MVYYELPNGIISDNDGVMLNAMGEYTELLRPVITAGELISLDKYVEAWGATRTPY